MAGRGDCLSWALLSEAERVCDLKLKFLSRSRTTAAVPVPQMRKSCFLALGKWFSPMEVEFFLEFLGLQHKTHLQTHLKEWQW